MYSNPIKEEQEVIDFAEKLPVRRGDGLLVSTAATRFLVVRHPFARLHAVWKALFSTVTDDGEKMFHKYSIGRYVHSQEDDELITFPDFCEFVADDSQARSVCDPCSNPFDFVAKFETLTDDANWLLERAGSNLTFPHHQEDTEQWRSAWQKVVSNKKQASQKLHQLYYWDFRLFGYNTEV
ncbi:Oidioi.mRNA.OKI2018_I69.XSR.g15061.t1.cds [Oikopleura dioica]|uniref:Carbohydrate sulfotransferase n=1 Tax=Oikopleura dioica TaxID=34765 RepID=A0ABN7SBN2_OIKDI|nr:Oidioi.mRNA.OKI2018_I69.XSR.g15061.t1.cds [Oikopleura dioica]